MTPTWLAIAKVLGGVGVAYTIWDMYQAKAFTTLPQQLAAAAIGVSALALTARGATQVVYGGI